MTTQKGFSLTEVIITLIVISSLAAVIVPFYATTTRQQSVQTARGDLISIYAAQRNFYFTNGKYCITNNGCNNTAGINANLSLNISNPSYQYACYGPGGFATAVSCTAASNGSPQMVLQLYYARPLSPSTSASPNPRCFTGNCPS